MIVIIDVVLSFMQKEINDGVHTTPDLDPKLESNATNEVDSILKTLCLEPYIPNFKEQVCIYYTITNKISIQIKFSKYLIEGYLISITSGNI